MNEARLMPLTDADQTLHSFQLLTRPSARVFSYTLPTGTVHHFQIRPPHSSLDVISESEVSTFGVDPVSRLETCMYDNGFYQQPHIQSKYFEYLMPTSRVQIHEETDSIAHAARAAACMEDSSTAFLLSLNRTLHYLVRYRPGVTDVQTSALQVLERKEGVCQDYAHLMIAICRRNGIPARYVSGYLYTRQDKEALKAERNRSGDHFELPEVNAGEERFGTSPADPIMGADAMHAWVECLLPDGAWHGFDPTNNLLTNQHYVKVHYGRDYADTVPLRGMFKGLMSAPPFVGVSVLQI
jgi:transglutaminase-like putative cysteine protease